MGGWGFVHCFCFGVLQASLKLPALYATKYIYAIAAPAGTIHELNASALQALSTRLRLVEHPACGLRSYRLSAPEECEQPLLAYPASSMVANLFIPAVMYINSIDSDPRGHPD